MRLHKPNLQVTAEHYPRKHAKDKINCFLEVCAMFSRNEFSQIWTVIKQYVLLK